MRKEATMKLDMALTTRSFLLRLALACLIVFFFALLSRAGSPKSVAGTSYFDSTATGQPLVWPQGQITYYPDQGGLSPILDNASANSLVADAFSHWTSVPTAALTVTVGGQLAEDVNGTNVVRNSDGTISLPVDIQSSATSTPIGVVYDYDGTVTDALIGSGAGDPSQCFFNAVFGGDDTYGPFATYQHGLIVINGLCAQQPSQLTDLEYRLLRTIGSVLGLGWSQVNPNVITGNPHANSDDYAGFPLMHPRDPTLCVPITKCYPNPIQLAMDDAAALSRLYPVTTQNRSSFPGKQVFAASTARIHGSVWFTDRFGNRTQPMQGVNVVARWIDPVTQQPSRTYVASSVSGFLFSGNQGNPITGFDDVLGDSYSMWGSASSTVQGFFDLAGLQLPSGGNAQYQLSVETLDPTWFFGVGPYDQNLVALSGHADPIVVTVAAGQDAQQDILMSGSAQPVPPWFTSERWANPAGVPVSGDWYGSLDQYGQTSYFLLPAKAGRTLSVSVTALKESGIAAEYKARPVIGMWAASDPEGTSPPAFADSFNTANLGMTRLDAQIAASTNFLIGIADLRGDGRPDYRYHAQVLYGDSVSPSRIGVNGGAIAVLGTGLSPGLTAKIGNTALQILTTSAGRILLKVPPQPDGLQSLTLTDPATGGSSTMTNVLTYGAAASDSIVLLGGLNPPTPVGAQAANPITVRVLAADGVTPVGGATVGWSGSNNLQLSACGGASSCSATTDQNGQAATWLIPATAATSMITATLAPGVYSPPKSVSAALSATQSASDLGVLTPYLWVAQGTTASIPLTARVLSNGAPQNNVKVNFTMVMGSGNLSAGSAQTNSSGYATVTLSLAQFASVVQVNACVAPANAPCQQIYANPIAPSNLILLPVAGGAQVSTGQAFQPVVVRVVDSAAPTHPVAGATVNFLTTVLRPGGSPSAGGDGETNPTDPAMPVILSVTQNSTLSDAAGLASIVPSSAGFRGPLEVDVAVTAGITASLDYPLQLLPAR